MEPLLIKKLPPMELEYQKHDWNNKIKSISSDNLIHSTSAMHNQQYHFTDSFNEGLSGILTEQASGWYYKHNLGDGKFEQANFHLSVFLCLKHYYILYAQK